MANTGEGLTIDDLKRRLNLSDEQLNSELQESELFHLAGCFDTIGHYPTVLGLSLAELRDVKDERYRRGVRAGMIVALNIWRRRNPLTATLRALLKAVLSLGSGHVAVTLCQFVGDKSLTIDDLKRRLNLSDEQLNSNLQESDLIHLAGCFDTIGHYPTVLGLSPAELGDVKDERYRRGVRAGMNLALHCWRKRNPLKATLRALLEAVLSLESGHVAVGLCQCFADKNSPKIQESRSGRETPEYSTMVMSTALLVEEFSEHVEDLGDAFYSEHLIGPGTWDKTKSKLCEPREKTRDLVGALTSKVKTSPDNFGKIVQVISDQGNWTEDLISRLRSNFRDVTSIGIDFPQVKGITLRGSAPTENFKLSSYPPSRQMEIFSLPGVVVHGRATVKVTNSAQNFSWGDHGLNLHVPQDALPPGVSDCALDVLASTDGKYLLENDNERLSLVYWLRSIPLCTFQKPLTLEIQHCAKVTSTTELTFVRALCSQEKLPYKFREVKEKGSFSADSSFGSLEVSGFSGYAIAGRRKKYKKLYLGRFFYRRNLNPGTIDIFFVIALDHDVYRKKVEEKFRAIRAEEKHSFTVVFENDTIRLDIPIRGIVEGGWRLKSFTDSPEIEEARVGFKTEVPHVELFATFSSDIATAAPVSFIPITLHGAAKPQHVEIKMEAFMITPPPPNPLDTRTTWKGLILKYKYILLSLLVLFLSVILGCYGGNALSEVKSTISKGLLYFVPTSQPSQIIDIETKPGLPDIRNFRLRNEESIDIAQQIAGMGYKKFATLLLNDEDGVQLRVIEANEPRDTVQVVCGVITKWLHSGGASWRTLVTTLRESGLVELANQIDDSL